MSYHNTEMETKANRRERRLRQVKELDKLQTNANYHLECALSAINEDKSLTAGERLLFELRAEEEGHHRRCQWSSSAYIPRNLPCPIAQGFPGRMEAPDLRSCYNKSTCIYILDPSHNKYYMDAKQIDTWLYRKWFHPYTTNISHGRYFSKIFTVHVEDAQAPTDARQLIDLHLNVCEQSQRYVEGELFQENNQYHPSLFPLRTLEWPVRNFTDLNFDVSRFMRSNTMLPIFRALFVVLTDYSGGVSMRSFSDVANLKVKLLLTGFTDGLSAPIAFDAIGYSDPEYVPGAGTINTTMELAFNFITSLEEREAIASVLQEDGAKPTENDRIEYAREIFRSLDPSSTRGVDLSDDEVASAILRPSHTWVDPQKFPFWTGRGAQETLFLTQNAIGTFYIDRDSLSADWWWDVDEFGRPCS